MLSFSRNWQPSLQNYRTRLCPPGIFVGYLNLFLVVAPVAIFITHCGYLPAQRRKCSLDSQGHHIRRDPCRLFSWALTLCPGILAGASGRRTSQGGVTYAADRELYLCNYKRQLPAQVVHFSPSNSRHSRRSRSVSCISQ